MIGNLPQKYRSIRVKFLPYTDYKPNRIRLKDDTFNESVVIQYDYEHINAIDQAIQFLMKHGFNIVGYSELCNEHVVFCDNWGKNCVKLGQCESHEKEHKKNIEKLNTLYKKEIEARRGTTDDK